jgi:iron complex outermembrane recepter protein
MGARFSRPSANIAAAVCGVLRGLSIGAPLMVADATTALAQPKESTVLATSIPAQPLGLALTAFAGQTGLQLVYVSGVVRNQRSHAAAAGLGANEALALMLKGTGLEFEYLTPHSIRIIDVAPLPAKVDAAPRPPDELQEILVSARRREEDLQNVPIAMQVLTGETLAKLNATTFEDYLSYLPGVTAHGVGPAQNNIYVRGLATAAGGIQGAGFGSSLPNVALYLDEQSVQLPFRNLDVYTADLERIEILEGPQGTLFGSGAEAGVVRYITTRPKLDVTEGAANAGYATTEHGGVSSNANAVINVPIIPDTLAVRGLIYNEQRGGYITNSPALFSRENTDLGIHYANYPATDGQCPNGRPNHGYCVPPGTPRLRNDAIAGSDTNPVTYSGLRISALLKLGDAWNALLTQSYQNIEATGVSTEMQTNSYGVLLPDLTVQLFNPAYNRDKFENTALTVGGRVGSLKLLYAGAYLVRNIEQSQDYTSYTRGAYADYYQCVNPQANNQATAQCFSPSSTWHNQERNTHLSQELRLSTPDEWRVRGVGGLYYEDYKIEDQVDFWYLTAIPYFNPIGPPTGYYTLNGSQYLPNGRQVPWFTPGAVFVPGPVTLNNPNTRSPGDAFFNDITRQYTQRAAYFSLDFDLVPQTLTLTAGTRYSDIRTSEVGASVGAFGCQLLNNPGAPNPCVNHSNITNVDAENLERTDSGFTSRATLSWKITQDALLYYTWSQGLRAGGFNRQVNLEIGSPLRAGNAEWQAQARAHGGWVSPLVYAPDTLTNNEVGWKTAWLDHRLQWNGALYQENWDDVQIGAFSAGVAGGSQSTVNGGNYRVRGIETFTTAQLTGGLTVESGATWNHTALIKEAQFFWADGTPIDFSTLQNSNGLPYPNPTGTLGSHLAGAPPFQGNIRARYEFTMHGYGAFAQIGAVHQSHSLATTDLITPELQAASTVRNLPAFTTIAAAVGAGKDQWLVQLYGENLTDTRAELYANYAQYYRAVTVNRPLTIGLRYSYRFGSK